MEAWGKLAQKLRVPAGTVLGSVFLLLMHPSAASLWVGGAIALLGASLRLWAAGHLEKGRILAQDGPYSLSRNPLYLGSLLMALGILIAGQGYWLLIPFALFYLAFYYPVMKAEEQELLQGYGQEFKDYALRVPLFFPGRSGVAARRSSFRWARVYRNREHRTVLGLLAASAFLLVRFLV